jgi:hypothetical protein
MSLRPRVIRVLHYWPGSPTPRLAEWWIFCFEAARAYGVELEPHPTS